MAEPLSPQLRKIAESWWHRSFVPEPVIKSLPDPKV
jgi:hypothetical protein